MQIEEGKRKQMLTSNYCFWVGLSCSVTKIFNFLNKSQPKKTSKISIPNKGNLKQFLVKQITRINIFLIIYIIIGSVLWQRTL